MPAPIKASTGPGALRRRRAGRSLTARDGEFLRLARGFERFCAVREICGERRGVRAARAVRRPALVALARDLLEPVAVEENVRRLLFSVAAGDDDCLRAEGVDCACELGSGSASLCASTVASAIFGVTTSVRGSRRSRSALCASSARSGAPLSATITGSSTTGAPCTCFSASITASIVATSPSIPIFTASTPMSSATWRTCSTITSAGHLMHCADAHRVLRGDRGDRGHPVNAAGCERLQVRLDAGSSARVGPGDREHAWDTAHAGQASARWSGY